MSSVRANGSFTIDGSDIMFHVPLRFYPDLVALSLVWKPHVRLVCNKIFI